MPDIETSRRRAREEKLQAHHIDSRVLADGGIQDKYVVYNVLRGTRYEVVRISKNKSVYWHCECPYMTKGSRLSNGVCKHIVKVQDKAGGCVECGRMEDLRRVVKDGPLVCVGCRFEMRMRGEL